MQSNTQVIEQRKIRTAKYAAEDFFSAVGQLNNVGIGHIILVSLMGISLLLDAQNGVHFTFSILTMILCFIIGAKMPLTQKEAIFTGMGIYIFLFVLELGVGGFPDPVSPALAQHRNWEGGEITRMLNALSPYFYVALRLSFVYPFLMMLSKLAEVKKQPEEYIRKAGFKFK